MRLIKQFEAFESNILSKTLEYMDSNSRKKFILDIQRICKKFDFPLSKLEDSSFEYLPFRRALNKVIDTTKVDDCSATSVSIFGDSGIPGEVCKGGKITRKWGKGNREVPCPSCNGTGRTKFKSKLKLIKFWFTQEGRYLTATSVDGTRRASGAGKLNIIKLDESLYKDTPDKQCKSTDLVTGDIVRINIGVRGPIIGIAYIAGKSKYVFQNYRSGGGPTNFDFTKIARYSWDISGNDYSYLGLVHRPIISNDGEVDIYDLNHGLVIDDNNIAVRGNTDIRSKVKDASFALVLDTDQLRSSDYNLKSFKLEREKSKKGSILDRTPDKIKRENIQRYIETLIDRLDLKEDIDININKYISKLLGYNRAGYLILDNGSNTSINSLILYYTKILSPTVTDADKVKLLSDLNTSSKAHLRISATRVNSMDTNIDMIITKYPDITDIINKYNELSREIYKNISSINIQDIEDIELVFYKIRAIRDLLNTKLGSFLSYYPVRIQYIDDGNMRNLDSFCTNPRRYVNIEQIIKSMDYCIRIIRKF